MQLFVLIYVSFLYLISDEDGCLGSLSTIVTMIRMMLDHPVNFFFMLNCFSIVIILDLI